MAGPPKVTLGYSHPSLLRPPTLARCVSYLPAAPATLFATHDSPKKRGRSRRRDERVLCPGGHLRLIPILQTSTLQRPFVLSRSPASLIRAYPASALSLPPVRELPGSHLHLSVRLVRLAANATRRKIREAIDQRNSLVFGCLYFRLFLFSFICIYAAISGFFFATLRFARECVTAVALAISSHLHRVYVYDYRSLIWRNAGNAFRVTWIRTIRGVFKSLLISLSSCISEEL